MNIKNSRLKIVFIFIKEIVYGFKKYVSCVGCVIWFGIYIFKKW